MSLLVVQADVLGIIPSLRFIKHGLTAAERLRAHEFVYVEDHQYPHRVPRHARQAASQKVIVVRVLSNALADVCLPPTS